MGAHKKIDHSPKEFAKPEKKKLEIVRDEQSSVMQKAEIDRIKKLLSEKIKDPAIAKKAAMIISEMLNKKS